MATASGDELATATGTAYGVGLRLEGSTQELLAEMLSYMPPAWQAAEPSPGLTTISVTLDDTGEHAVRLNGRIVSVVGYEDVFDEFERSVRVHLAYAAQEHFFLHAGAVAHHGKGIVILGSSFSGKTTLVSALVRAGCVYFSDENAVLDADGRLHPYPKPLGLRLTDGLPQQTAHDVESLGGVSGTEAVPLALVLAPEYRPDARWAPTELSPSETVQIVLQHAYQGLQRPQETIQAAHAAASNAAGLKGDRGEADETAALILQRLAESA